MAVVPTVPTFVDGVLSSSQLNQLGDAIRFALNPAIANLRQTSAQTLSSTVWASITLDAEDIDKDFSGVTMGHDPVTNNSRYTAVYPGYYVIGGGVGFSNLSTPSARRGARLAVNGSAVNGSAVIFTPGTGGSTNGSIGVRTTEVYLFAGDYAEIQGYFEGGGTLATSVTAEQQSSMTVFFKSN
jgi:hypothetical protein